MARTKLNSKKSLESFLPLPSIFGYFGKGTKNTAEHVLSYLRKGFVHSGSIGPILGKHARYVITFICVPSPSPFLIFPVIFIKTSSKLGKQVQRIVKKERKVDCLGISQLSKTF